MNLLVPAVLFTAACSPTIDFDLDFGVGPVVGERGNLTFTYVDGCATGDAFFGCRAELSPFAEGSQVRFSLGSLNGAPHERARIALAKARSLDSTITSASRDADGILYLDSVGEGDTTIEIVDDGDTLDTLTVHVEPIVRLTTLDEQPAPLRARASR
jgi:hypothetical protein